MSKQIAVANGTDLFSSLRQAAESNAVQDAVNPNAFHRRLLDLHRSGTNSDDLINHPVSLGFTSKLNSLCRMSLDRELAALEAIDLGHLR